MPKNDLPSFGTLLRNELRVGLEKGFSRVIPWLMIACSAVGYAAAHFADPRVFSQENWSTLAAVYGGVVTFNGLTLALSWSAIGRIYDTVSKAEFSRFLRASGLLNTYLFYVSLIHTVQVVSALAAVLGLVSVFLILPITIGPTVLAIVIATTLYAIRWAAGSSRVVKDLAWHYATFDDLSAEERRRLYAVAAAQ